MTKEQARPDPMALLKQVSAETRRRVLFRVYLGYARGVGTTTAMLDEGRRRSGRGTDVVVASYRVNGQPERALRDLEVLGPGRQRPRQKDLDIEAVLARNPAVVCIDDLAEASTEGTLRLESVARLMAAGITALATEVVLGHRHRIRRLSGGTTSGVIRGLSGVDVHILRAERAEVRQSA